MATRSAPGPAGGRRGVWASWILIMCALVVPGPARAQFSVYPATVELEAGVGAGTRTLMVENQSDADMEVRVYLSDYDRLEDGGHVYQPFGEHERSCGERLAVFPDQLALGARERGEIRLQLDLEGGTCWGVVFVEKRTLTASGITMAQRIGVKVLAQSASGAREGRVLGMAVDTAAGRAAVLGFANEGERALNVEGEIEVRDLEGEIVEVVEMEGFQVLPGRARRARVPLDGLELAPGRYVLVAILDFGAEYLAGGQAMLDVRP